MAEKDKNQAMAAQRFWDAFRACLEENRVRPDGSTFYVKWAQRFVDFVPGKKLRDRSAEDIRSFLENLRNRPRIEEWQVQDAGRSLRSLSVDPRSGKVRRHHIHESSIQKTVRDAALRAGISKKVSCHTVAPLLCHHDLHPCLEQTRAFGQKPG
jgi:hypothetical protein